MGLYTDRMKAERAQRLARMTSAPVSPAPARAPSPAPESPDRSATALNRETAAILSRIEAIERVLAASGACPAEFRTRPPLAIAEIKAAVCRHFGLRPADLAERPRPRDVSRARRIAIYLARQLTGKSFRALARAFGDRSHPSIIRAFRSIERLRSADAALDRDLEALASELDSILRGRPA
jgi:chromosomal replication initiation ATPase DnaA